MRGREIQSKSPCSYRANCAGRCSMQPQVRGHRPGVWGLQPVAGTPLAALRHTEAAGGGAGSVISLGPPLTFTTEPAVPSSGEPQNPFPPPGFVIVLARCLPRRPDRLSWALSAWCRGRSLSTMSRFRGSIKQLPPR